MFVLGFAATPHAPLTGIVAVTVSANTFCIRMPNENKNIEAKTIVSRLFLPMMHFTATINQ